MVHEVALPLIVQVLGEYLIEIFVLEATPPVFGCSINTVTEINLELVAFDVTATITGAPGFFAFAALAGKAEAPALIRATATTRINERLRPNIGGPPLFAR
jgi:hypothetical protein